MGKQRLSSILKVTQILWPWAGIWTQVFRALSVAITRTRTNDKLWHFEQNKVQLGHVRKSLDYQGKEVAFLNASDTLLTHSVTFSQVMDISFEQECTF